jgi:glycosyltransferase involved in cell wall biosynthesis
MKNEPRIVGQRPTLSVVLPHYNHATLITRALDALLAQAAQADEILILDDCSTDNSLEVIQGYVDKHPHVRLYQAPENGGVCVNANRGLEMVSGEFVYWGASDDFVLPGFFERCLDLLAAHPEARMSCTIGDWRDETTGLDSHIGAAMGNRPAYYTPKDVERLEMEGRLMIPSNTILWHRETLIELGGLDAELQWHSDWFLYMTFAFRYGFCFVPEPLAVFSLHPGGLSALTPDKAEEHRRVLLGILRRLDSPDYQDIRQPIRESGALFVFGSAMETLLESDPEYRGYLTPLFRRKRRWHSFKMWLKPKLPKWLGELLLRLTGAKKG